MILHLILAVVFGLAGGLVAGAPLGHRIAHAAEPEALKPLPPSLASLRGSTVVDDTVIRLGDLFRNVGEKADIAVAYAPAPGRRAVFDVQWLTQVARSHRIRWGALSRYDRVVIKRASQTIWQARLSANFARR